MVRKGALVKDIRERLLNIRRDERLCHIYREIQKSGPIAKSKVGLDLRVSKPTRYSLLNTLLDDGIIVELKNTYSKDKRQSTVDIVEGLFYSLGIDIHLKGVDLLIMDLKHKIKAYKHLPNSVDDQKNICLDSREDILERIKTGIIDLLINNNIEKNHIISIGISDFGMINNSEGISIYTPHIKGWQDVPIRSIIKRILPVPIYLNRDANLMTIAEVIELQLKNFDNLLLISVRRGVGLGIFINGKLYQGHSGSAGEWSHTKIVSNGEKCTCGKKGCLDTVLGYGTLMKIAKTVYNDRESKIHQLVGGNEELSPGILFQAYEIGDPSTVHQLNEYIRILGQQMANLFYIFDPYLFILSGYLKYCGDSFLYNLNETIKKCLPHHMEHKVQVLRGKLGLKAASWGAAFMAQETFFTPHNN